MPVGVSSRYVISLERINSRNRQLSVFSLKSVSMCLCFVLYPGRLLGGRQFINPCYTSQALRSTPDSL